MKFTCGDGTMACDGTMAGDGFSIAQMRELGLISTATWTVASSSGCGGVQCENVKKKVLVKTSFTATACEL